MFRRRHDEDARYFFVHLQKTAGTSLYFQLREAMGARAVYPDRARGDYDDVSDKAQPVIAVDHLERRWAARRREIRVITGHFPMCTTDLLDADFRTFTLLRDPVERTLSYLRHHLELYPDDGCASIEDVYDDDFRFHGLIHNHMVKMFSLTVDEMDDGALTRVEFGSHHLQRAKENLAQVDVVGLQERYAEFCGELNARFRWKLSDPKHMNRTKPVPVEPGFRERIAADNALDVELYTFARELSRERAQPAR